MLWLCLLLCNSTIWLMWPETFHHLVSILHAVVSLKALSPFDYVNTHLARSHALYVLILHSSIEHWILSLTIIIINTCYYEWTTFSYVPFLGSTCSWYYCSGGICDTSVILMPLLIRYSMDLLKTSLSVFDDFKLTSRLSMALMFKMLLASESIKYSTLHSSLVNIST